MDKVGRDLPEASKQPGAPVRCREEAQKTQIIGRHPKKRRPFLLKPHKGRLKPAINGL